MVEYKNWGNYFLSTVTFSGTGNVTTVEDQRNIFDSLRKNQEKLIARLKELETNNYHLAKENRELWHYLRTRGAELDELDMDKIAEGLGVSRKTSSVVCDVCSGKGEITYSADTPIIQCSSCEGLGIK